MGVLRANMGGLPCLLSSSFSCAGGCLVLIHACSCVPRRFNFWQYPRFSISNSLNVNLRRSKSGTLGAMRSLRVRARSLTSCSFSISWLRVSVLFAQSRAFPGHSQPIFPFVRGPWMRICASFHSGVDEIDGDSEFVTPRRLRASFHLENAG